jgi:sugar-specific transcriptional regulator TrmB
MTGNNLKLLQSLVDIGLSEREAKVYLALLGKRRASASELQRISGIPRSKVYEVINGLAQRGYCIERKSGRNRTFEVINPSVTLDPAFNKLEERLKDSLNLRGKLINLYKSAEKIPEPVNYIEVLHGNDSIHHRYCQLVRNTHTELLGFGRKPYACDTSEKSAEQDRETEEIVKRGGAVRWIFELDLPEDEWILNDLRELNRNGQQIRIADKLPLKMMIFDMNLLLVAEEEPFVQSGKLNMSLIKQSTIVNAFYALFEFFWVHSLELATWEKKQIQGEDYTITRNEN